MLSAIGADNAPTEAEEVRRFVGAAVIAEMLFELKLIRRALTSTE